MWNHKFIGATTLHCIPGEGGRSPAFELDIIKLLVPQTFNISSCEWRDSAEQQNTLLLYCLL